MSNFEMERPVASEGKESVRYITEYARLKHDIYGKDNDTIDFETIDEALENKKISFEQHVELTGMIRERDALIRDALTDAAKNPKDDLTGLPKRNFFESALGELIDKKKSETLQVMFIDLNNFKSLNDKRGHRAGDEALTVVANVLKNEHGVACRNGGDEFAYAELSGDLSIREKIRERINNALKDAGFPQVTVAIGLALSQSGESKNRQELMGVADKDMYKDKKTQKKGLLGKILRF